ncbi:conserved hypothetical protein [gamma proteobacterium HTCC5015]|nr:conserved hypothetical protein [gamma proteobacterium HTCC5015]
MKLFTVIFSLILLSGFQLAFAHSDHAHGPITEASALQLAKEAIIQLTEKDAGLGFGKLPNNWKATPATAAKIHKKSSDYFIVSVANATEAKTLYVLISSDGEVYDANFTGEFDGLE